MILIYDTVYIEVGSWMVVLLQEYVLNLNKYGLHQIALLIVLLNGPGGIS
jgi:hypothetical protein